MKLDRTQRSYMINKLIAEIEKQLDTKLKSFAFPYTDDRVSAYLEPRTSSYRFILCQIPFMYSKDTCTSIKDIQSQIRQDARPPRAWWEKQIKAKAYSVEIEYAECMKSPRVQFTWTQLEAEKRRMAKARPATIKAQLAKGREMLSEAQYLVMETNKLIINISDRIMLSNAAEARTMLDILGKEITKHFK